MLRTILVSSMLFLSTDSYLQALVQPASPPPPPGRLEMFMKPNLQTYIIRSASSQDLGSVTVSGSGCSASKNVPSAGDYSVEVGCTITTVTIQGHAVTSPSTGPITLSDGAKVQIGWGTPNVVEIVDTRLEGSPVR